MAKKMYSIGFDIGSSSIKASLVDLSKGEIVSTTQSPETEMTMDAPTPGWAEQDPDSWWHHVGKSANKLQKNVSNSIWQKVKSIGLAYQMHGLVILDRNLNVIRPSIIWCDSRAVESGNELEKTVGHQWAVDHLLNPPGNFTAAKLNWLRKNEPESFKKVKYAMLPGDYIAYKLSGEVSTTPSGLSEGMWWDHKNQEPARPILEAMGIDESLIPDIVPTFTRQGTLQPDVAEELGLGKDVIIGYRAGDQPNNALALNVLNPGEVAGTAGTSGVIYAVVDEFISDDQGRVNTFAHVNHTKEDPRLGILLNINGCGIQYSWVRNQIAPDNTSYMQLEQEAASVPIGSDGLTILPFGNGAERMFKNRTIGSQMLNLDFNWHGKAHIYRAALEGIASAFAYGARIYDELGVPVNLMKVGNDNMFQSSIFSNTVATLSQTPIEVYQTSGASGAAIGAAYGAGLSDTLNEAFAQMKPETRYEPQEDASPYQKLFERWNSHLNTFLSRD